MHLVYNDPLDELTHLIELARRNPRIKYVAVTKSELRMILKHGSLSKVLPRFAQSRTNLLRTVNAKIVQVKNNLSNEDLSEEERLRLFSVQDTLEKQKMDIEDKIPKQIVEEGYTIKVTLK